MLFVNGNIFERREGYTYNYVALDIDGRTWFNPRGAFAKYSNDLDGYWYLFCPDQSGYLLLENRYFLDGELLLDDIVIHHRRSGFDGGKAVDHWFDEDGNLCIRYENGEWYHYGSYWECW